MQNENTAALSYLFTPSVLSEFFHNRQSSRLVNLFNEFNMLDRIYKNSTLKDFFEDAYEQLLKSYRNEYVFKNAIAQKILIGRHSIKSSSLFTEMRVETSKADVVIFNGTSHVYEIKTDLDNFERLESQIKNYKKVFEYVNVVSVESKINDIKSLVDDTVGIIVLTDKYTLKTVRKPQSGLHCLDKEVIFSLLRKNEYLTIIKKINGAVPAVANTKIYSACKDLFIQLPIEIIHKEVLKTLKERKNHKNLVDTIKDFPGSLKIAILEANLSPKQQVDFLELLNQKISSIFQKDLNVSPVF
ncbi:MAG: sce7726 family protein [Campylobacteraceae bacterium]|nr:sce7726 family protein [Campylobacteraceae bacterium]